MGENQRIVFISYAHKDVTFVNAFASELLRFDLNVWKDSKDIPIGGNIPKSIYDGIKKASHFCCIISASSVKSKWVEEELSFAKVRQLGDSGLQIIPVLIDKVEAPDYVAAYRYANLENRDLSLKNPEFLMLLKAFGTDLEEYSREILTGEARKTLLQSCGKLFRDFKLFREILGNLQNAYNRYQSAQDNWHYDPPMDMSKGRAGSFEISAPRTTHGSDYQIASALDDVAGVLTRLKVDAADVQTSIEELRRVWEKADPTHSVSRLNELLFDPLDLLSYASKTVAEANADEPKKNWWMREKLSEWNGKMPSVEAAVASAMALLESWAAFDPKEKS
jgi:hypothetical protein